MKTRSSGHRLLHETRVGPTECDDPQGKLLLSEIHINAGRHRDSIAIHRIYLDFSSNIFEEATPRDRGNRYSLCGIAQAWALTQRWLG